MTRPLTLSNITSIAIKGMAGGVIVLGGKTGTISGTTLFVSSEGAHPQNGGPRSATYYWATYGPASGPARTVNVTGDKTTCEGYYFSIGWH